MLHQYRVVIPYREPTFELHTGKRPEKPYRAPYVVVANSKEEALQRALELFEHEALHSHVGWVREPEKTGYEVELI